MAPDEPAATPAREKVNAERLKEARLQKRYTLRQTAEELGVVLNTVWRYENGSIQPSVSVLRLYGHVFKRPVDWFFSDTVELPTLGEVLLNLFPVDESGGVGVSDDALALLLGDDWHYANEPLKESVRILVRGALRTAREQMQYELRLRERVHRRVAEDEW